MNYRRICQIQTFLALGCLGIVVDHNSYNLFLGVASAIAGYFLARSCFKGKLARVLWFAPVSVVICQLSVTAKKAIMDEGFKQVLSQKPVGVFFADVLYGFRHVVETAYGAVGAVNEALAYDQYSSVESINYRFFAIAVAIAILAIFLLKEGKNEGRMAEA